MEERQSIRSKLGILLLGIGLGLYLSRSLDRDAALVVGIAVVGIAGLLLDINGLVRKIGLHPKKEVLRKTPIESHHHGNANER